MKAKMLLVLIGSVVITVTTLFLPFYLIYLIIVAVVDLIHTLLDGCAEYFEIVKDCLKGDL